MDIRQLVRDWIVNNGGILDVSGPAAQDLIERLRAHCTERDDTALREALEGISLYGKDTLSGPEGGPITKRWLYDGVGEMVRRADALLGLEAPKDDTPVKYPRIYATDRSRKSIVVSAREAPKDERRCGTCRKWEREHDACQSGGDPDADVSMPGPCKAWESKDESKEEAR